MTCKYFATIAMQMLYGNAHQIMHSLVDDSLIFFRRGMKILEKLDRRQMNVFKPRNALAEDCT